METKKIIENYSFQFIEVGMKNRLFENEIVHFISTSIIVQKRLERLGIEQFSVCTYFLTSPCVRSSLVQWGFIEL